MTVLIAGCLLLAKPRGLLAIAPLVREDLSRKVILEFSQFRVMRKHNRNVLSNLGRLSPLPLIG